MYIFKKKNNIFKPILEQKNLLLTNLINDFCLYKYFFLLFLYKKKK